MLPMIYGQHKPARQQLGAGSACLLVVFFAGADAFRAVELFQ